MKKRGYLFLFIIIFIFLLGLYFRLNFYFFNRPLWHDECSLAINILYKNYIEYFGALAHNQSAPPLFMILTKFLTNLFGIKEVVLRFLPLCSSIISIPVFFIFSKRILKQNFSIFFANFLFCINYYIIYYCQEFKQYSSDILIFLITYLIVLNIDLKTLSAKKIIFFSLILSLAVLSSLPSLFVIFAFLIVELYKNKKNIINKLILFFSPIITTFIILYFSTLLPSKNSFLVSYWQNGFISFDIASIVNIIKTNLTYYFYPNKLVLIILILICIGAYSIIKNYKERNNLLIITICLSIITASFLQLYPIMQRVSLYITPILIILISKPIDFISVNKKVVSVLIILLYILSFNSYNFSYLKQITKSPDYSYDARMSMKNLKDLYRNNELIIVNAASDSEFIYYSAYYNLNTNNYVFVQTPNKDKELYFNILNNIPEYQNVWFFYVNDYSHSPVIPYLKEWVLNKNIFEECRNKNSFVIKIRT